MSRILEIEGPARLGIIENRFVYRGRPRHEIVFVFDASFVDRRVYGTAIPFREAWWTGPAEWIDLAVPLPLPLYPAGLDTLLREG